MKEISKIEEMGGIVGDRKYERLKDGSIELEPVKPPTVEVRDC